MFLDLVESYEIELECAGLIKKPLVVNTCDFTQFHRGQQISFPTS